MLTLSGEERVVLKSQDIVVQLCVLLVVLQGARSSTQWMMIGVLFTNNTFTVVSKWVREQQFEWCVLMCLHRAS